MAKVDKKIQRFIPSEQQIQAEKIQELQKSAAQHEIALQEMLEFVQVLHESGLLEIVTAFIKAREHTTRVVIDQLTRPPVTRIVDNIVQAASTLGDLDPKSMEALLGSVVRGVNRVGEQLNKDETIHFFDLLKAIRDPQINRAFFVLTEFLRGMGEKQ